MSQNLEPQQEANSFKKEAYVKSSFGESKEFHCPTNKNKTLNFEYLLNPKSKISIPIQEYLPNHARDSEFLCLLHFHAVRYYAFLTRTKCVYHDSSFYVSDYSIKLATPPAPNKIIGLSTDYTYILGFLSFAIAKDHGCYPFDISNNKDSH